MKFTCLNRFYLLSKKYVKAEKQIAIITYHSISNEYDDYTITPQTFITQIESICNKYDVVRLKQIKDIFSQKSDNLKVVITFDDAYENLYKFAYPVMLKHSVPCTIFIPFGFIGKSNEWDANKINIKKRRIMNSDHLLELEKEQLVDFGSHSIDHVNMRDLHIDDMRMQAIGSKKSLEEFLNREISMFAYPYGYYSKKTTKILAEAGYEIGVTSNWGTLHSEKQILELKRIHFQENDERADIRGKIKGIHDLYHLRGIGPKLQTIGLE